MDISVLEIHTAINTKVGMDRSIASILIEELKLYELSKGPKERILKELGPQYIAILQQIHSVSQAITALSTAIPYTLQSTWYNMIIGTLRDGLHNMELIDDGEKSVIASNMKCHLI